VQSQGGAATFSLMADIKMTLSLMPFCVFIFSLMQVCQMLFVKYCSNRIVVLINATVPNVVLPRSIPINVILASIVLVQCRGAITGSDLSF
jgi:hypothetical protein